MAASGEAKVLKALKSRTKKLSLDNSGLRDLPVSIGRLDFLEVLSAKNNVLSAIGEEVANLKHMSYLNLGSNRLQLIPTCICGLPILQTLHVFHNCLTTIPNHLPRTLTLLNLNNNSITTIPPSINQLTALKQLSLANNSVSQLPEEICSLHTLEELHLNNNNLESLPWEIGKLHSLRKLLLQKNKLRSLPPTIGKCRRLGILDVSANELNIFPPEVQSLSIKEFYFENNPLLPYIPVPAEQYQEVIPLKETACRVIVSELQKDCALMSAMVSYYAVKDQLDKAGDCAMCGQPFVSLWLDCVYFELPKKVFKNLQTSSGGYLPIKAQLCSYKCFNTEGHKLFGIAEPPVL